MCTGSPRLRPVHGIQAAAPYLWQMILSLSLQNIILILFGLISLLVLLWLLRYAWLSFREKPYQPIAWMEAMKQGQLSQRLIDLERNYPDKVRFINLWLQTERIRIGRISGDIAELGVYQGQTAAVLHALMPGRMLHLFDTFNGFSAEDLKAETGKAAGYTPDRFSDTTVESVLTEISGGDMVKVWQGHFPGSAPSDDTRFALVSMDADLYKPTIAGLDYFWPRMEAGGVILIHDHNPDWPGIIRAVGEFCRRNNEEAIPVPDQYGTVMIFKK